MTKLPNSATINELASTIRSRKIPYLTRFGDTLNRYIDILLRKDNDSRMEWAILSLLIVRGGSITPTQLARELFRSKHSITRFIDSLVRKGFVTRTHKRKDRRSINIILTKSGITQISESFIRFDNNWKSIISDLTPEEWETYLSLTRRLQKALLMEIDKYNNSLDSE